MNNDKINDIIKNLIDKNPDIAKGVGESDIKNILGRGAKEDAIDKLKKMGLAGFAKKLEGTSDDDLLRLIAENPDIIKKINSFVK